MLTTLNFFYHFQLIYIPSQKIFYSFLQNTIYPTFLHKWPQTFYLSTLLKLNFFSLDFQHNSKIHNPTLTISSNRYNNTTCFFCLVLCLILIFNSFSDHISYTSKSCFSHIRDLRRIHNTLDHKTACTIATSLIHSKLDYMYLFISTSVINNSSGFNSFSTQLLVLSQKLQNSISLLLI